MVKTRFQLSTGTAHTSVIATFKEIIRTEGLGHVFHPYPNTAPADAKVNTTMICRFSKLYRGIASPILGEFLHIFYKKIMQAMSLAVWEIRILILLWYSVWCVHAAEAPKRAVKFSTNEQYKRLFRDSKGHLSGAGFVAAGACAGMTESVINCPFELVKVRMQAKSNVSQFPSASVVLELWPPSILALQMGLYNNTWDGCNKIVRGEGITVLYRGLGSMLVRRIPPL